MTLKEYLASKTVSSWCREHGITPEAIFQFLSGKRDYLGIEIASLVVRATGGAVPLESLVRPRVAQAVAQLMDNNFLAKEVIQK